MANNKNNADASLYSYGKNPSHSTDPDHDKKILAIATVVFFLVVLLIWLLCVCFHKHSDEEDAVAGVGNRARHRRQSSEADRAPPPTVAGAAIEVVTAELQLVCTYRKADDWRDSSCGVCLSDLADGDVLRVLPLCMHYFHAACIGEWLRRHHTCPLCRAPLVATAAAA